MENSNNLQLFSVNPGYPHAVPVNVGKSVSLIYRDQKPISFLKTWDAAAKRELEFSCESLPRNAFDEKIMWTNEGKLWSFPIDNEVGELFISI